MTNGTMVGSEQPTLRQRRHPVAGLHGVVMAPLLLGLYLRFVRAFAEARLVVTGVAVGDDLGFGIELGVGEALQRAGIIVVGVDEPQIGRAHV